MASTTLSFFAKNEGPKSSHSYSSSPPVSPHNSREREKDSLTAADLEQFNPEICKILKNLCDSFQQFSNLDPDNYESKKEVIVSQRTEEERTNIANYIDTIRTPFKVNSIARNVLSVSILFAYMTNKTVLKDFFTKFAIDDANFKNNLIELNKSSIIPAGDSFEAAGLQRYANDIINKAEELDLPTFSPR